MLRFAVLLLPLLALGPAPVPDGPAYTAAGELKFPTDYPEWVFLGAGIDMSYNSPPAAATHSVFNTVFANPSAYRGFKQTGVWPEGTVLVLENRMAGGDVSINKRGKTQTAELMGLEVHVKDSAQLKEGWAFYRFQDLEAKGPGKLIPRPADCYTCHEQHAAADTTFVQFYPTLLPIAAARHTLSPAYLRDRAAAAPAPAK